MARPRTLSDFTGDSKPSGDHMNYRICPICGSDGWKVFVNPATGGWNCFAGRCGAKGFIEVGIDDENPCGQLLEMFQPRDTAPVWEEVELPEFEPLEGMALRYLAARGVTEAEVRRYGMVEWVDRFRIVVPYFDSTGNLIYWNSRRYSDQIGYGPKYLAAPGRHPLFSARAPSRILAIVEGVFDAIAVRRSGYSALALGGKSLPRYLRSQLLTLAAGYDMIVVMLDPDALASALKLQEQLADVLSTTTVLLPDGKDPGDMTPDEIREVLLCH